MAKTKGKTAGAADLRELVGDLLYMAERFARKTPATETVIFDARTKKELRTINYHDVIARAKAALRRRPQPARWAGVEYHYAVCSKCRGEVPTGFDTTAEAVAGWSGLYPFCPHCGTPMRSGEYDGPGAKQYRSRKRGAK